MKSLLLTAALTFVKIKWLPDLNLLSWAMFAIVVDFATGIIKARMKGEVRTSKGFRQTIVKFLQYGGALIVSIILGNTIQGEEAGKAHLLVDLFQNGLIMFILYIEVTSICENLYAMDPESALSRYFIKYALNLLTFQLKNNPATQIITETKDEKDIVPPAFPADRVGNRV